MLTATSTYDQPSNRRRNATPQYIEALESQLKRAKALLHVVFRTIPVLMRTFKVVSFHNFLLPLRDSSLCLPTPV
jgi:hypothetical protein